MSSLGTAVVIGLSIAGVFVIGLLIARFIAGPGPRDPL